MDYFFEQQSDLKKVRMINYNDAVLGAVEGDGEGAINQALDTLVDRDEVITKKLNELAEKASSLKKWKSNESYALDDIVIYDNKIYLCTTPNSDTEFTSDNWVSLGVGEEDILSLLSQSNYWKIEGSGIIPKDLYELTSSDTGVPESTIRDIVNEVVDTKKDSIGRTPWKVIDANTIVPKGIDDLTVDDVNDLTEETLGSIIDSILDSKVDTHNNDVEAHKDIREALDTHTHSQYLTGITKSQVTDALGYIPPQTDTNTDTKVTSVDNHYAPVENTSSALNATISNVTLTDLANGSGFAVVTGLKRDAAGHVVGVVSGNIKATNFDNTDTKNTAGSTNTTSKIFLVGATGQSDNPQTYSDANVYTTNGTLRSTKMNIADKVTLEWDATSECLNFVFA